MCVGRRGLLGVVGDGDTKQWSHDGTGQRTRSKSPMREGGNGSDFCTNFHCIDYKIYSCQSHEIIMVDNLVTSQ